MARYRDYIFKICNRYECFKRASREDTKANKEHCYVTAEVSCYLLAFKQDSAKHLLHRSQ
jgi:hypothetical protein